MIVVDYNDPVMIRSRYRRIVWFFARQLSSLAFWELLLPRIGLHRFAQKNRAERLRRVAVAYRSLAVQMGGVLIKVGQFLSSRVDVLPDEFTRELEGLQDEVPPVPFEEIRKEVETGLNGSINDRFASFDPIPLAAASLGQVHRATTMSVDESEIKDHLALSLDETGTDVVVKVLRPNIERIIETDLAALRTVGSWLHRYKPIRKRADVPGLLSEFTRVLYEEIDYESEGHNAEIFAMNFNGYPGVRVPKVDWRYTTNRVLTLENVFAIKITNYEEISSAGVSRSEVASRLLNTYLKQIFEDGFFHADPHPGNLFIQPLDGVLDQTIKPREFLLTFVDFGMTGKVSPSLRSGLRELLIGVGTKDSKRVVHAYQMMDMLLPGADLELLERMDERVFEKYWGMNMSELTSVDYREMRELADEFREVIYEMPFQVPQNIIFLVRCIGILSGMCTGLDPEFNVWTHLAPFAQKIIIEEASKAPSTWMVEAEKYLRVISRMPHRLDLALGHLERGEIMVRSPEISKEIKKLTRIMRGLAYSVIFASLLLAGVIFMINSFTLYGTICLALSVLFLLFTLIISQK